MSKRLVKVAKELNVGTSTIVEFLNENGFEIDNKPTSKVTEEMETLLQQEYSKSIAIKEQADSMTIGLRPPLNKEAAAAEESVVVAPPPPPPPPPVEEPIAEEEAKPKEETKKPVTGLKIKGKIDLDEKGEPVRESKEEPIAEEEAAPKESAPPEEISKELQETVEEPQPDEAGPPPSDDVEKVEEGEAAPSDETGEQTSGGDVVKAEAPELRGLKYWAK